MPAFQNLEGQTFGKLHVLGEHITENGNTRWLCQCVCGKQKMIWASSLRRGTAKSCGCSRGGRPAPNRTHGESAHGDALTPEYCTWAAMIQRCTNKSSKNYKNWGGRGIQVCERWRSYQNFLEDMGRRPTSRHTLDRKDNNGDYTPENCRWATSEEQGNNRRTNHRIQYGGETLTLTQWAQRMSLQQPTLRMRLKKGWSIERALTTPSGGA